MSGEDTARSGGQVSCGACPFFVEIQGMLSGVRMEKRKTGKVAFVGDSILHGWGVAPEAACWRVFQKETGLAVIQQGGTNPMAQPGATLGDLLARTPGLIERYRPDLVFVSAGANHFDGDGRLAWPYGMTEEDFLELFFQLFSLLKKEGAVSVWLGFPALEACGRHQERPLALSRRVGNLCGELLQGSRFFLEDMLGDPSWDAMGGRFYDNLAMDLHPNAAGQACIAKSCVAWLRETGGQML